ncbi:MAG TPA: hypothetical protein VFJ29_01175 [Candidatus Kapabacteria bacterium]|nr:hypothetical protein [Candidatus Kapabacteria bacterium]
MKQIILVSLFLLASYAYAQTGTTDSIMNHSSVPSADSTTHHILNDTGRVVPDMFPWRYRDNDSFMKRMIIDKLRRNGVSIPDTATFFMKDQPLLMNSSDPKKP